MLSKMDAKLILERIDKNLDEYHDQAWGFYVYWCEDVLIIGDNVIGNYDGISVHPDEQDKLLLNGRPCQRVTFLHSYPIKTTKDEEGRTRFSGVDIGSEFAKAVHKDDMVVNALAYKMLDGRKYLKIIVLDGKEKCLEAMQRSNPDVGLDDIMSIDTDGRNNDKVDWVAFQKDIGMIGMTEVLDITEELTKEAV